MAFPTIVGTPAESATATAGTTHTINLPSGASGNLFLLVMSKGPVNTTINALTGWTELVDEAQASGAFAAWHLCDGTEGATVNFTSASSVKSASIVYEINGQSAIAPQISAVAAASTTAPDPNTCTPTGGAKDYLWITWFVMGAASEEADDDTWVNNAATNYGSLLQKTSSTAGTNVGAAVASCHRTNNAASEDAVWPTGSTDLTITWRSFTIGVHPLQLVSADTGGFTETGIAATTVVGRELASGAATGSYALSGVDTTLLVEAAGTSLSVDPGSYSETGISATIVADRLLSGGAVTGVYTETAIAADLLAGRSLAGGAETAIYAESGVSASLALDRMLSLEPATYTMDGIAATFVVGRGLVADVGSYVVSGIAAGLEASGGGAGTATIAQSMSFGRLGIRLG